MEGSIRLLAYREHECVEDTTLLWLADGGACLVAWLGLGCLNWKEWGCLARVRGEGGLSKYLFW